MWDPKWLLKPTLWATTFDQQVNFSQHCRPYCSSGGGRLETPWLIVAGVAALLVPFCTLLAPVWYPFGTFLKKQLQLRWTLLGSLAFHYECFFHFSELTYFSTEGSTDTQPISTTSTLIQPSHRQAEHLYFGHLNIVYIYIYTRFGRSAGTTELLLLLLFFCEDCTRRLKFVMCQDSKRMPTS